MVSSSLPSVSHNGKSQDPNKGPSGRYDAAAWPSKRSVLNIEGKDGWSTIHYPSKHQLDNWLSRKSISIYVYGKLKEVEDRPATEALK